MSYVVRAGNTYRMVSERSIEVFDALPPNNYVVKQDPISKEFHLEPLDPFEMPKKFYGNTIQTAERILNTFNQRPLSTGVHLDGVKGSGKTLLSKVISHIGVQRGIPTIIINGCFHGEVFNQFIQSINVPAIVLFDEFEKIYDYSDQNKILTLFDGVYPTKKLFILTTNDGASVSRFLKNRPGRIYYSLSFTTLSPEFVREYLEDNLNDKSQIEPTVRYAKIYSFFTFDMLAACVEEMNRYNEPLSKVLEYINVKPEVSTGETYTAKIVIPEVGYEEVFDKAFKFNLNDFCRSVDIDALKGLERAHSALAKKLKKAAEDEENEPEFWFTDEDISGFDPISSKFTFTRKYGETEVHMVLERNRLSGFDMRSVLI